MTDVWDIDVPVRRRTPQEIETIALNKRRAEALADPEPLAVQWAMPHPMNWQYIMLGFAKVRLKYCPVEFFT